MIAPIRLHLPAVHDQQSRKNSVRNLAGLAIIKHLFAVFVCEFFGTNPRGNGSERRKIVTCVPMH